MAIAVTINGSAVTVQHGWIIRLTANGRGTFTATVKSADGSVRPARRDVVTVTDGDVTIFGGLIDEATEAGLGGYGVQPIATTFTATDYNVLAELRHVTEEIPAGTLKAALTQILPYLQGVTLHDDQDDGPTLPARSYADVRADVVLNDLALLSGGYLWEIDHAKVVRMFEAGTLAAPFNIVQGAGCKATGDIRVSPIGAGYANRVIVRSASLRSMAEDTDAQSEETGVGLIVELLARADDAATQEALDATAATLLAKALAARRDVTYPTKTAGLRPRQTQTIEASWRGLNNSFLIREVQIVGVSNVPLYTVKALEGATYQEGWREDIRRMLGSTAIAVGGAGGASVQARLLYPLGGSGLDAAAETDGTSWYAATGGGAIGTNPYQIQYDTVAHGRREATVSGRLRAEDEAVGVKARVYDLSNSQAVGESGLVTNTAWETVTFGVTMTAGKFLYELQIWSDTAGAWVRAGGFYLRPGVE